MLADLHLGKINHFRRSGVAVPFQVNRTNIESLLELIALTKPERILCLGDLFHSHYNQEWETFGELVKHFSAVSFELVIGNHDVMSSGQYVRKGITLHDSLAVDPFVFTHHPLEEPLPGYYNLAGHVHPGVVLKGLGKQSETLPCFYFGAHGGILPAFGHFTGLARIYPQKNDKVFVIAENKVIQVPA